MLNRDIDRHYQDKQRQRYNSATSPQVAHDALWRAASAAGYLHRHEVSQDQLSLARIGELTRKLGWG